jgi:hypothetical protein
MLGKKVDRCECQQEIRNERGRAGIILCDALAEKECDDVDAAGHRAQVCDRGIAGEKQQSASNPAQRAG